MAIVLDKLTELEYNELATLQLIEKNADLLEFLYEETTLRFPMIYQLQKEGKLEDNVRKFTQTIFDSLIVTKQEYIDRYLHLKSLLKTDAVSDAVNDAVNDAIIKEIIEEETTIEEAVIVTEPVVETKSKVEKPKNEKKLPRRYGKQSILEDIKKQGGTATSQQRAGLKVGDLKNIYVNLERRLINDMLTENQKLSVEDYRLITATIEIVETKLKEILKRK